MHASELKSLLYNKCREYVKQRILNAQTAIDSATESGNDEVKSSAGDKHETGRAMAQLEQEKSARQLWEALELRNMLSRINPDQQSTLISVGSLVITDQGNFYISIPAGKIEINGITYFAVSPKSPVALALSGFTASKEINFNGLCYRIESVV